MNSVINMDIVINIVNYPVLSSNDSINKADSVLPKISVNINSTNDISKNRPVFSPHPIRCVSMMVSVWVYYWQKIPEKFVSLFDSTIEHIIISSLSSP